MEKLMEEEDLKGLEEEIDNAVDRLFVERKKDREESFMMESPLVETPLRPAELKSATRGPVLEPPPIETPLNPPELESAMMGSLLESLEPQPLPPSTQPPVSRNSLMDSPVVEPRLEPSALEASSPSASESSVIPNLLESSLMPADLEASFEFEKNIDEKIAVSPASASSETAIPMPLLKSIDRMEAQLLSLEWEITGEKIEKAKGEVLVLKDLLRQNSEMSSILGAMEKLLTHMMKKEEAIRPSWIKFLLDAKETIKLLTRKETSGEINIYKQLAYLGIESRFSCLEGVNDTKIIQPPAKENAVHSFVGEKKIEEMGKNIQFFMKRVEEIFGTLQEQIVKLQEKSQKPTAPVVESRSQGLPAINVTIFKVDEKLFGVESQRIFKLFKVPNTFEEKYSDQQKVRLRNVEVKLIDLKKLLGIQEAGPREQIRILTVKENGGYKGFMVDEILKRVSVPSDGMGEADGFFSGIVHTTHRQQAVEIPILDLNKF